MIYRCDGFFATAQLNDRIGERCLSNPIDSYLAGHFFPEEDDKFLERVRAAVEEEERQLMVAADTDAAKNAIATAEESRKHIHSHVPDSEQRDPDIGVDIESRHQKNETANEKVPELSPAKESRKPDVNGSADDSVANLPMEFYHYYHGSNTDIGTLIEVIMHI